MWSPMMSEYFSCIFRSFEALQSPFHEAAESDSSQ
jgi:hypothetical protein